MVMNVDYLDIFKESSFLPFRDTDSRIPVPEITNCLICKDSEPLVDSQRRNPEHSSESVGVIPYRKVKVLSRYLAASKGSCHDHCKCGSREALETEATDSKSKWNLIKLRRKLQDKKVIERSRTYESDSFLSLWSENKIDAGALYSFKTTVPRSAKKEIFLSEELRPNDGRNSGVDQKLELLQSKKASLTRKGSSFSEKDAKVLQKKEMRSSFKSSVGPSNSRRKGDLTGGKDTMPSIKGDKMVSVSGNVSMSTKHAVKKIVKKQIVSLSHKASAKGVARLKTNESKKLEMITPLMDQSSVAEVESGHPNAEYLPEKILHVVEPENRTSNPTGNGDKSSGSCMLLSLSSFKDKPLECSSLGVSIAPVNPSSLKKKTLRITNNGKQSSQPLSSPKKVTWRRTKDRASLISKASSKSTLNNISTRCDGSETGKEDDIRKKSEYVSSCRPKNTGINNSKDTPSVPRKLRFKKPKELETRSRVSSPKTLKVKRRHHNDTKSNDADMEKPLLRNADINEVEVVEKKTKSKNVVLRHHGVQQKEATEALNDVIEDTANKLVDARKSKVKFF